MVDFDLEERIRFLDGIAAGHIPLRDVAGLNKRDIASLAQLAAVAFQSKKFEQAARIFAGLEALEPDQPEHVLHRAHAEAEAGQVAEAMESITRYIDHDRPTPREDMVRALIFRATLCAKNEPEAAASDVTAARLLAKTSPAAQKALEGSVR